MPDPATVSSPSPSHSAAPKPRPLRPGQRHPCETDRLEADADLVRSRIGRFPHGPQWALTAENVRNFRHNFWGMRGDSDLFRSLGDLSADEFALLLWDLDCYRDLLRKGHTLPPLEVYLFEGREEWGSLRELLREALADGLVDPVRYPAIARAAGLLDARDEAIRALAWLLGERADSAFLAALNVGQVDLDEGTCVIDGRTEPLGHRTTYALDCYLDLRPELRVKDPLFLSREGDRLSPRQVRRILERGGA